VKTVPREDTNVMLSILRELAPLNRVFCAPDYDRAIDALRRILPFEVCGYTQRDEVNGWAIPPRWEVKEAKILRGGRLIYDGLSHPLAVISLSAPFRGVMELEELRRHLHYDQRFDHAIPYHFRQQYRSWQRDWGFCVTRKFYDSLEPGKYEVILKTEESPGTLKVLSHKLQGLRPETFVFCAHLDHPGMANDDLAGCAVAVELFRRLAPRKLKFSYQLLLVPEITGSEYYLAKTYRPEEGRVLEGIFVEMLGTETELALQRSLGESSNLEKAVERALLRRGVSYRSGPFKGIVCNDECIWEAYSIPMASLSRFPYPQYHTHLDDLSIISERALEESLSVLQAAVEDLESTALVTKKFQGTLCLSHPQYDLYIDPGQPAFATVPPEEVRRMRLLMDLLPTLRHPVTVRSLAERVALPESEVAAYLDRWRAKGLLEIS
jgi:aminopeptidase-like protein